MSLTKARLKILNKIAQQTAATTTTDPSSTATTTPTSTPVPQAPALKASEAYPTLRTGFDPGRVVIIDALVSRLNMAVNTITSGQYNFQTLKSSNFQFDPSAFPSPDQKYLVLFFQKVFQSLLNKGQTFTQPMSAAALNQSVQFLLQSPELNNLSQTNPGGQVAQQIPGNFKDGIRELIARLQPTVPTRRA